MNDSDSLSPSRRPYSQPIADAYSALYSSTQEPSRKPQFIADTFKTSDTRAMIKTQEIAQTWLSLIKECAELDTNAFTGNDSWMNLTKALARKLKEDPPVFKQVVVIEDADYHQVQAIAAVAQRTYGVYIDYVVAAPWNAPCNGTARTWFTDRNYTRIGGSGSAALKAASQLGEDATAQGLCLWSTRKAENFYRKLGFENSLKEPDANAPKIAKWLAKSWPRYRSCTGMHVTAERITESLGHIVVIPRNPV